MTETLDIQIKGKTIRIVICLNHPLIKLKACTIIVELNQN